MSLHTGARQLTALEWAELAEQVFSRDGWDCLARRLDPNAGTCHDRWGNPIAMMPRFVVMSHRLRQYLTLQHIVLDGRTENDARHLLSLCWGHHLGAGERGGRIWSKTKDAARAQRDYLIQQTYPVTE